MPDQHAAATEHDLITQVAEPLGHLPDDPLSVVSVDFPIALRGYDRFAVDAYVERTAQLVAELQATRSPEAAVRRALERVGEEISGILQRAHDTADEITARSRSEADERLETARREATELTVDAERQVKDLDAETERIWAERHSIVTDAQELAARLMELAESAMQRFPADGSPPVDDVLGMADGVPAGEGGIALHIESVEAGVPAPPFDGAVEGVVEPGPLYDPTEGLYEPGEPLYEPPEAPEAPEAPLYEAPEAPDDGDPTVERTTTEQPALEDPVEDHHAVEDHGAVEDHTAVEDHRADPTSTDQPTVDMPPIEPWEGDPRPFGAGEA
jgi:hypothetical protein